MGGLFLSNSEVDFNGYEYHPEFSSSVDVPLSKRYVRYRIRHFKPHCQLTGRVCFDFTINCHDCSIYRKAFSYGRVWELE
jgi:hypothetical protein